MQGIKILLIIGGFVIIAGWVALFTIDAPAREVPQEQEEVVAKFTCPEVRPEICTADYIPVCADVQVQCITTPCDPIPQTFSNACTACSNQNVLSYSEGACTIVE